MGEKRRQRCPLGDGVTRHNSGPRNGILWRGRARGLRVAVLVPPPPIPTSEFVFVAVEAEGIEK